MKKSLSHKRKTARTSQSRSRQRRLVFEMLEDRKVMTAPVLDPSASPVMDATEGKLGANYSQVYSLVDGSITDPDGAPVNAIAIIGVKNSLGTLQYQLPSTTDWLTINADLLNSQTNELALLLGQGSKLRFFPFGNLNGSIPDGITFRAWDRSSGSEGQYTVITSTGGNTAFSTASDTVEIRVRGVNEAPSFAPPQGTGTQIVPVGNGDDDGRSMVVQPDGRILIAGTSSSGAFNENNYFSVTRLNPNGSVDISFGAGGRVLVPIAENLNGARSLALQPDGRILVAGFAYDGSFNKIGLIRLNPDGSLDTSFDSDGKAVIRLGDYFTEANSVTVQPDGKILVDGFAYVNDSVDFALVRMNADGSLDTSFDSDGIVTVPVGTSVDRSNSVNVQSDGRILVAGYSKTATSDDFSIIRLNANGSLDTSFDSDGRQIVGDSDRNDYSQSLLVQPDGRILVAGYTGIDSTRYDEEQEENVTIKLYDFSVIRLNPNGTMDSSFDSDGMLIVPFESGEAYGTDATLQPNGQILVSGYVFNASTRNYDFALIRLNTNGSLDTSFGADGKVVVSVGDSNDYGNSIAVQPDGRIVVAGTCDTRSGSDFCVVRVNTDGTMDRTINDPVTSTLGGTATFTQNGSPVVLDHDVRIFDPEMSLSNFNGSTLTLFRNGGAKAEDNFSSTGSLATLTQGGNLVVSGTAIGTVTTNSGGTLVLTFNTNATNSLVNAAMQQIAYANTETNPPDAVQIRWIFRDGDTENQSFGTPLIAMDQSTVAIHLINNAPVLDASKSPSLGSMLEGATNPSGVKVSDMIVNGSITDADGTAVKAIAVTGVNTSLGTMQYSLDNGNNWLTINSAAINSQTDALALLLGPAAKLRFIPFGNLNGSLSDAITFRAWDQRSGKQGDYTVITRTGGSTAFSAASDTADLTLTAVNSAPSFSPIQGAAMNFVSFGGISDEARSVSVRSDGRILVGGGNDECE